MELIYADDSKKDLGVVKDFILDLAFGKDENNFVLEKDLNDEQKLKTNYWIYVENSEIGGIIDGFKVDTKTKKIKYYGRTFQGFLNSFVIIPDDGKDYLEFDEEYSLFDVIGTSIDTFMFGDTKYLKFDESLLNLKNIKLQKKYRFDRYVKLYDGLSKFCKDFELKLKFYFKNGIFFASVEKIKDYSQDEFSSIQYDFVIDKKENFYNLFICLGKGELKERNIIYLFFDKNGQLYEKTKSMNSMWDVIMKNKITPYIYIYDYSIAENEDELIESAKKKYTELKKSEIKLSFKNVDFLNIGDIIGAREETTKIFIKKRIAKKIINFKNDEINIRYEVID